MSATSAAATEIWPHAAHQFLRLEAMGADDDPPPRMSADDALSHAHGVANGRWRIGISREGGLIQAVSAVDAGIAWTRYERLRELLWLADDYGCGRSSAGTRRTLRRFSQAAHELARIRPAVVEAVRECAREHERQARALRKAVKEPTR